MMQPVIRRQMPDDLQLLDGERWYLVQTQPRKENIAEQHLGAQLYRVFLPLARRTIRHARRMLTMRAPVFPGYLFVILDLGRDRWRAINGTVGVSRIIGAESRPLPVPCGLVETMLAHTSQEGVTELRHGLRVGQRARVVSGPFAQLVGTLEQLDGNGRVRLLLQIMGAAVTVSLPEAALVPLL